MGKDERPPRRKVPQALTPEELARERWLPIPDWDGYDVSDLGRVRSWKRSVKGRPRGENWIVDYSQPPRIRAAALVKGYRAVTVSNGRPQSLIKVSRTVLLAFVGPAPPDCDAAHWNGCCTDDRLSNLRWATRKENSDDKVRHQTMPVGSGHTNAKLTEEFVAAILLDWSNGLTLDDLAEVYATSRHTLRKIVDGETWRHVKRPLSTPKTRRRLSAEDVSEIRRRKANGETLRQLSVAFNKSVRTIWLTVNRKRRGE